MPGPNPVLTLPSYHRSARRDVHFWALLAFGAVFAYAGWTIDPATNCSDAGECAPILVPIGFGLGALSILGALAQLWANPNRGSHIDPVTGELVWWQNRTRTHAGDSGRIHPAAITRIRIDRNSESADEVHVYDQNGERLAWLGHEVIPCPYDRWAHSLARAYPHIVVEERE